MKIERVELHHIELPLVHPFQTSFGIETIRPCILVAVSSDGLTGWGECPAGSGPWYSYETVETAWHVLRDFLIPAVLGQHISNPANSGQWFKRVRGHPMAKAGLENALWDLQARSEDRPLSALLGGIRQRVEVGVSIGIQPSLEDLLDRVDHFVSLGYRRVKVKIKPGWDLEPLTAIRERQPELRLMADANSAFSLDDAPLFKDMDPLRLLMIEQPLGFDDIADHAKLQAQLETPLCLDESIHSPDHARWALEIRACRIINVKVARVGGLNSVLAIHDLSQKAGVPLWCGGMLETGIGRATNLHLATLPNFTLPGDISATSRYYAEDIAEPVFSLNRDDSTISVPAEPGLGVTVQTDRLERARVRHSKHSLKGR
jgi:o-succinylbenzoate synthase